MATGQINSYGIESQIRLVSDIFEEIKLSNTPFLNEIKIGKAVSSTKLIWWDAQRIPTKTALTSAYTAASGSMVVASVEGLRVNTLVQVGAVIAKVSAINAGTKTLTITALEGDANQTSGAEVVFINNAEIEGSEYKDSDRTPDLERFNVTQIMSDYVNITGTTKSISNEVKADVLAREVKTKLERLKYQFARGLIVNPRYAPANNADGRIMGGLRYFINQYGYNPNAALFSTANIDAFLAKMENEYGIFPKELWMNPVTHKNFNDLNADKLIIDRLDGGRGNFVKSYLSGTGREISLKTDPAFPEKEIVLCDTNKIAIRPLKDRDFFVEKLAKRGDYEQYQLLGEYTAEINQSNTFGIFKIS